MKTCTKCGVPKKDADFGKRNGQLKSECKKCLCARAASFRLQNLETVRKRERDRYAANIEEVRMKNRKKYHKNAEKARQSSLKWKQKHPEHAERAAAVRRLKSYGITPEDFNRLLTEQGGRCSICSEAMNSKIRNLAPCVDHDHNTGKIRGVLCRQCNVGLGNFKDSSEVVQNAFWYLCRHARAGKEPEFDRTD